MFIIIIFTAVAGVRLRKGRHVNTEPVHCILKCINLPILFTTKLASCHLMLLSGLYQCTSPFHLLPSPTMIISFSQIFSRHRGTNVTSMTELFLSQPKLCHLSS